MRRLILGVLTAAALAQVPLEDRRNTYTPDPETHFIMPDHPSLGAWRRRRRELRAQILAAAGLLPARSRAPLESRVVWKAARSGVIIETVLLETLPGYYVGGNVYRPAGAPGRLPAVLSPHGHWKRGRIENEPSYSVPALGINLARQGYLVFAWDMVGYNDTRQTSHHFGGWREQLWGFSPMGLQLWNALRSLDYVRARRDVDSGRIAVTGASGGATQTFLLTAVDSRVQCAAPVNMISAYMQGGDPCEEAPGLRAGTFNVEFAAMAAPRPMLVVSSTGDWTRHTPREEFPALRRIYGLFGVPGRVANAHFEAKHNYNRESRNAVYGFLAGWMLGGGVGVDTADRDIELPDPEELLAVRHTSLPADALDFEGVFRVWREAARREVRAAPDSRVREALRHACGAEWPRRIDSAVEGKRLVLARTGRRDRVAGIWMPGAGPPALVVHPDGAEAALASPQGRELAAAGRFVYAIDAFQTGSSVAPRDRSGPWFLSYNHTDDANRVQDILTALAFLRSQTRGRPRLVGLGAAAPWCLFAAAVAPVETELAVDLDGFEGRDEDFRDRFFVPGIQAAGGLEGALRLVRAR